MGKTRRPARTALICVLLVGLLHVQLLALALLATGCRTASGPMGVPSPTGAPPSAEVPALGEAGGSGGREMRLEVAGQIDSLSPLEVDDDAERTVCSLLFSSLAGIDPRGQVFPDLAVGWVAGRGGMFWTVRLRPDALWHDGEAVTSDDVLFTLEQLRTAPGHWLGGAAESMPPELRWEKVDARTVRFFLPYPDAGFPYWLAGFPILPLHILREGSSGPAWQGFGRQPVGCGPYKISAWEQGSDEKVHLLLEAHARYHRGAPRITRLAVRVLSNAGDAGSRPDTAAGPEAVARPEIAARPDTAADLRKAVADLAPVAVKDVDALRANGLRVLETHEPDYVALALNCGRLDTEVRRAVAHVIDHHALVRAVGATVREVFLPIPPACQWYPPQVQFPAYAPEEGVAALKPAGEKGKVLKLHLPAGDAGRQRVARMVASYVRQAGIPVEIVEEDVGAFASRFLPPFDYDLALMRLPFPANPDLTPLLHSGQIPREAGRGANVFQYREESVDRALGQLRQELDADRRKTLVEQVLGAVAADVPFYPLWTARVVYAHRADLRGPAATPFDLFWNVNEWHWQE